MELTFRWGHRQLTITALIKEMTQREGKVMHDMENKQNEGKLEGNQLQSKWSGEASLRKLHLSKDWTKLKLLALGMPAEEHPWQSQLQVQRD